MIQFMNIFYYTKSKMKELVCPSFTLVCSTLHSFPPIVNGGWSGWSAWSGCAAGICAGNQRIRTRTCTNPIPLDGGAWCTGENAQRLDCLSEYSLQNCCFLSEKYQYKNKLTHFNIISNDIFSNCRSESVGTH